MTTIARFTPARHVLQHRFDRIFDELFGDAGSTSQTEPVDRGTWLPAVDIRETKDGVSLEVELAGVAKDAVGVSVENGVLTIAGERKFVATGNEEVLRRSERAYGKFSRSFTLPNDVERDKVEAKFQDGLLTVRLPKAEATKPRSITIQ
ncbi:MAG: Hsp20/alpha crystallin family protein [Thermoanaerobaculia bacterium]|nr:Hsp20/alpha crystallin family protein [Thermoanaerobaculia bacterium]